LREIRRRLIERAPQLGFEMTEDPNLVLFVDGRPLRAAITNGNTLSFCVPEQARQIRIVSRVGIPAGLTHESEDLRPLGVPISRIVLRRSEGVEEITADDLRLVDGFHRAERDGSNVWRWTDGNAKPKLPAIAGSYVLELHLSCGHRYWITQPPVEVEAVSA
jgi:hypothetical protein